MMPDPYLISLHGGSFDGYRKSVNFILLGTRLEMPGTLPAPDSLASPSRRSLYEFRQASIEIVDGLPTMVLDYDFIGMRAGRVSATITRFTRWKDRLARELRQVIRGSCDARHPHRTPNEDRQPTNTPSNIAAGTKPGH
jgi:hypothetical protein